MRPLERIVFATPTTPASDIGAIPRLEFVAVDRLVVDPSYQRDINRRGHNTVRHIINGFRWSMFSPIVVAPLEDGRFAIIDGQHRATAALMHGGVKAVPAMIVDADRAAQARAFSMINGQVTAVQISQIFHARVAGGDPGALALKDLCDDCGVIILKQPVGRDYRIGETLAIGTLQRCHADYGHDILHLALKLIVDTGDGNAGWLRAPVIKGLCAALFETPDLIAAGAALFPAFDKISCRGLTQEARQRVLDRGGSEWEWVKKLAIEKLGRALRTPRAAA